MRSRVVMLVFILVICLIEISLGQTWNGSASSNWNTASNWTPATVPGAGNDVIINNPASPNQPTLPGNISIRDLTINNGILNLANFTLTVTRNATISGGVISNGTLNVNDYNSLQNTTFNGTITLTKTGSNNDDTNGGNIYNGPTTIRNNDNSRWRHGNTNGDIFNSLVTFIKASSGDLQIAYNGSTVFNNPVTINNLNAGGTLSIGLNGGTSILNTGGLVTSSFALGNLDIRNFTQVTNTPNGTFSPAIFTIGNSTLLGSFNLTASNGITVLGNNRFCTGSGSVCTLIKNGGGINDWIGGNTFGTVSIINNSNSRLRLANSGGGDTFNSTSIFTNTGNNFLGIAFFGSNSFAQQITINNSNANGEVRFGEGGGTSTLTTGGVVTSGFSVGTLLEFNNFTQTQNSPNGNFGVTTFTSINSSFQGDFGVTATTINLNQANTFARNGTFTATNINLPNAGNSFATAGGAVTFTKTGGGTNQWNGGNTFGILTLINNSNALFRLGTNTGDTFNSTSNFTNTGTNFLGIAYRGTNTFAQQITINNSNANGEVRFGEGGGISTLATGGVVTSGFSVGNILEFNNFTQVQNSPNGNFGVTTFTSINSSFQGDLRVTATTFTADNSSFQRDINVTATTINFTRANTFARNGTFTATNFTQTLAGSSFATAGGAAIFTKNGGAANNWYGSNTFGAVTFVNNSNFSFRLANNLGDTFNSTSVFTNTGTNFIDIAYRGANTFGQQITVNNSNPSGSIRFGEITASSTSTLAAGGVVTSGFSTGALLEFNNFTQTQNAANGTFGVTTFTSASSSFQGNIAVNATAINFINTNTFARNGTFTALDINQTLAGSLFATAGGAAIFNKTGGGANQWFGGNTFGTATFNNNSNQALRLAFNTGDTFNSSSIFNNTGTTAGGIIEIARSGTNSFAQQIAINNSNALGSILIGENAGTSTQANGGLVTSGFPIGILRIRNFTQLSNSPNGGFIPTTFTSNSNSFQGDFSVISTGDITFTGSNTFARTNVFQATNINTAVGNNFSVLSGATIFTKTGGAANLWPGGNTYGNVTFVNNSNSVLRLANTSGDTFNGNVVFLKSSIGNIEPAYNGTNTFGGNITTTGSTTPLTFGLSNGIVQINGTGSQSLSGNAANFPVFRRIEMNSSSSFTLNVPLQISLYGNFTSGTINSSSANSLTYIDNATTAGASDASYVAGPVIKIGNDNFEFPIGKSGFYAPSILGVGGATTDSYTSEYFNVAPHAIPTDTIGKDPTIGLMNKSEHWNFTRNSGAVVRSLALGYNSSRTSIIIDHNELIMIHWNSVIWQNVSGSVSGNATAGFVTRASNPSSGLFSIASSFRILPIELLAFKAEKTKEKNIRINWITATEKNNAFFTLEKSLDGKIWQSIAIIPGSGNSLEQVSYEFLDKDVRYGRQFYRLTQTDYDGRFETFQVIGISLIQDQGGSGVYNLYPNPTSGRFTLQGENMNLEETTLEIHDLNGRLVLKSSEMRNKKQEFDLSSMPKGIYVVKLFSLESLVSKKLIIH